MHDEFNQGTDACIPTVPQACSSWYLAYTRPRLETMALQNLQHQGFEAYLPLYKRLKKSDDGMAACFEPMFARYVFFRTTERARSVAPVHFTRGVAHLVRFGYQIATIRPETLEAIRQLEQERNAASMVELSALRPGVAVRFRSPALRGLEGLVKSVSSRRVIVLLELMGREQLVSVEHHLVEEAA